MREDHLDAPDSPPTVGDSVRESSRRDAGVEDLPRRIRVVTLVDRLAVGGGERLAAQIAIHLDATRFERTLCATRWTETIASQPGERAARAELEASGVRFVGLARRGRMNVRPWVALIRLLRRERVDVLHAHLFGSNLWAVVLGRLTGVPVIVVHDHGRAQLRALRARRLLGRLVIGPGASAVIAVSEADRRRLLADGLPARRVVVVATGVPTSPTGDGATVRRELGIGAGDPVVLAVGRLHPAKSFDVLIRASAQLAGAVPGVRVLIAGDGDERDRLAALVSELGASATVTLLGRRTDVGDLLAASDVAVCSSTLEASPLAVMEYMAAGRPIVATRAGGVPELIEDGVHGLLVEPEDPESLAAAITGLLADPARAARLGDAARIRQAERFGLNAMVVRIATLYEDLRR